MLLTKLLVNMALFLLFLFFSAQAIEEWKGDKEAPVRSYDAAKKLATPQIKAENQRIPSENDYRDIIEHNLFSPGRVEYVPAVIASESAEVVEQPLLASTKFTLYGIVLMDDYKRALISNPTPKPGEPRDMWIKIGDTIGSLKVEDIFQQNILVSEEGKQYKIPLYDQGNPKARVITPTVESEVTVTNIEKTQAAPKVENKATVDKKSVPESEYIDTPFGKVKRDKR